MRWQKQNEMDGLCQSNDDENGAYLAADYFWATQPPVLFTREARVATVGRPMMREAYWTGMDNPIKGKVSV